ncbi:MAG: radical SAM protein [bacterium]
MSKPHLRVFEQHTTPAVISQNNFKFKSLSNWGYNISYGCVHGCSFCYVPEVTAIKAEKRLEKSGLIPEKWVEEREQDSHWGEFHWGDYCLLRTWDEDAFRKSLKAAERAKKVAPDSNRAIMLCTATDPYQTLTVPGDPQKTKLLNDRCEGLVTKALEIILKDSTLNVRILTRSPLAKRDFPLFKKFGDRLVFGMSIPTLDDKLSQIYEPGAPGPTVKLKALQEAVAAGLHVYVALAPTLPDDGEEGLRKTMKAVADLKPITIFHEPINIRAENVARIEAKAKEVGRPIRSEVFASRERWREYAFDQFALSEEIARDLKIPEGVLHQWPDEVLESKGGYLKMRRMQMERDFCVTSLTAAQKTQCEEDWKEQQEPWVKYWHSPEERISSWPGIRMPKWK